MGDSKRIQLFIILDSPPCVEEHFGLKMKTRESAG